ncbi:MAG: lysostaphin resistance A-like protein [Acidimicrobiia bacterium]
MRVEKARISWGLPDALLVWLAGGAAAVLAGIPAYSGPESEPSPLYSFGILLPAQQFAVLGALVLISRGKGRGTLRDDFGLALRRGDARGLWWGVGCQFALTALLYPLIELSGESDPQQLLEDLEADKGVATIAFFVVGAVVMAPLVEELLYRGLLLRALQRRMSPTPAVFASAVIFALVHLVGDPGAAELLPALAALGVLLGLVAVRTASLSLPIFIHAGFNLTTALLFVLTGGP